MWFKPFCDQPASTKILFLFSRRWLTCRLWRTRCARRGTASGASPSSSTPRWCAPGIRRVAKTPARGTAAALSWCARRTAAGSWSASSRPASLAVSPASLVFTTGEDGCTLYSVLIHVRYCTFQRAWDTKNPGSTYELIGPVRRLNLIYYTKVCFDFYFLLKGNPKVYKIK